MELGKEDWYDHQFKWPCPVTAFIIIAVPLGLAAWKMKSLWK